MPLLAIIRKDWGGELIGRNACGALRLAVLA
jgi:hypothetical protein